MNFRMAMEDGDRGRIGVRGVDGSALVCVAGSVGVDLVGSSGEGVGTDSTGCDLTVSTIGEDSMALLTSGLGALKLAA